MKNNKNPDDEVDKDVSLSQNAVGFLKEVRNRFPEEEEEEHDVSVTFRKLLRRFAERKIEVESLVAEVKRLFEGQDDLIHKFNAYLPPGYRINLDDDDDEEIVEEEEDSLMKLGTEKIRQAIDLLNNVKIRFRDEEAVYMKFLGVLEKHTETENLRQDFTELKELNVWFEVKTEVADLLGEHVDLYEEFERYVSGCQEEKVVITSVQDLDLSKCAKVSPSYWLLPECYQWPRRLGGDDDDDDHQDDRVLNDTIVCVPSSGKGKCYFNKRQRSKQEQVLFRYEENRFQLDMLIERMHSIAKTVEKLMKGTDQNQDSDSSYTGQLSALNLKCFKGLYREHGLHVIENLCKTPETALPVKLETVKRKVEDLVEYRSEVNRVWTQVCAEDHNKLRKRQRQSSRTQEETIQNLVKNRRRKRRINNSDS